MNPVRAGYVAALRILIACVFVYAGLSKAQAPEEFRLHILSYRMIPVSWTTYVGQGLPFLEAIGGFWLLLGWRHRVPALAALLLSAAFAAAISQALARGIDIRCGCFGERPESFGPLWRSLGLDALLLAGSAIVYRSAR